MAAPFPGRGRTAGAARRQGGLCWFTRPAPSEALRIVALLTLIASAMLAPAAPDLQVGPLVGAAGETAVATSQSSGSITQSSQSQTTTSQLTSQSQSTSTQSTPQSQTTAQPTTTTQQTSGQTTASSQQSSTTTTTQQTASSQPTATSAAPTATPLPAQTPTATPSTSDAVSPSATGVPSPTATKLPATATSTPGATATLAPSPTAVSSATATATFTPGPSPTASPGASPAAASSAGAAQTPTATGTAAAAIASPTPTGTAGSTTTATAVVTGTTTPSPTPLTATPRPTGTAATATATGTVTVTAGSMVAATPSVSPTPTPTATPCAPPTATGTPGAGEASTSTPGPTIAICVDNSTTTSATSGTAGATGAAAANQLANTQSSTAQSSGGSGTTMTSNRYTAIVTDAGAATVQSGFAGAVGSTASTTIDTGGTQLTASAASGLQITPTWPPGVTPTSTATPTPTKTPTVTPTLSGTATATPLVSSQTLTITNSSTTLAQSGDSKAAGVVAANNVTTSSATTIDVKGQNPGQIRITTDAQVNVANIGVASAASGDSRAAGAPANVSVSSATQPASAAASITPTTTGGTGVLVARSGDVVAIGNTVQNTLNGEQAASRTVTGSAGSGATLTNEQSVALSNQGRAGATSGAACAQCGQVVGAPASSATPVPAPTPGSILALNNQSVTVAASGDANAVGLVARNDVQSQSKVNVAVEGDNYGIINVVIKFITNIVNLGRGSAQSGETRAAGAPAEVVTGSSGTSGGGTSAAEARSGDALAVGARVENHVGAAAKTDVVIEGDNRSPLKIITRLIAKVFNFGQASSRTGDAAARGAAGSGVNQTVARSGRADALGLDASNDLQLTSEVNVRLKGSNYSRINIEVYVEADVWNEAYAQAQSGAAVAEGGAARSSAPARVSSGSTARPEQRNEERNEERPRMSGSSAVGAPVTATSTPSAASLARTAEFVYVSARTGSTTQASSGSASGTGVSSTTLLSSAQTAASNSAGPGAKSGTNTTSLDLLTLGISDVRSGCARTGTLEICPSPTPTPQPRPAQQETHRQDADNEEPGWDGTQVRGPWVSLSDLVASPWRLIYARPRMAGMPGQLPRLPALPVVRPAPAPVPVAGPQAAGLWDGAEPGILAMPTGLVVERGGPGSMPVPRDLRQAGPARQPVAPVAGGSAQVLPSTLLEPPAPAELAASEPPPADTGTIESQAGSPPPPPTTARPLDLTCLTWWSLLILLGTLLYRQRLRLATLFQRVRWRRAQLRASMLAAREDQV